MKKRILFFLAIACISCVAVNAQIVIKGTVIDANDGPLVGVNIIEKGTTNGVISNLDGQYSISVKNANAQLVFSYISYKTKTERVGSRKEINVILEEDTEALDEVVVVGYGVQRKSDLTSSISSVKGKDVRSMNVGNATESLQGKVAGITIVGAGGPGAQPKVLIRGFSTINLSTDPLYVVDGVPMGGGINFLNPNEIESIEVLKDASASAIYGSRASNGVIMVTTRKGKEGKPSFYLDMHYGVQEMKNPYNMADASEYAEILNAASSNAGYPNVYDAPSIYAGKTTNWWDAGIREYTPQFSASIGVQGGTDKNKYAISLNYYQQDSFYQKGEYQRFTARFTNDYRFNRFLSAGFSINPRYESWGNPSNWADFNRIDPITPIFKPEEELTGNENEFSIYARSPSYVWNPVGYVARWKQSNHSYAFSSSAYLEVKPLQNLIFRSQFSLELDTRISNSFSPDFVIDPAHEYQLNNKVSRSKPTYRNWSLQNTLSYLKSIDEKHNMSFMLGNTLEEWNSTSLWGSYEKLPNNSDSLQELDAGTLNPRTGGSSSTTSILSYFGRVSYNYNNKYYLTATYRLDGSSKFMSKNKWASFPSASLAWRVSSEPFMESCSDVLSVLKLRAGWGRVGNQNLPSGVYMSKLGQSYYAVGDNIVNTTYPSMVKNVDVKWETVEDYNFGIDYGFFNNKLSGSLEYYVKNTRDMLFQKAYPSYSGFPGDAKIWTNVGSMRTKGFEMSLSYNDRFGDFSLGAMFNLTTFNVKTTELTGDKDPLYGNGEKTKTIEGDEPGFFYGYVADGLFQNRIELNSHTNNEGKFLQPYAKEGDVRFRDINGDGLLNADDRTKIGSPWADVTMGLNLNLGYKNFDLVANFYASVGNDLVNQNISELYNAGGGCKVNKVSGLMDMAWHGEGTSNSIPRLTMVDNNENFSKFSSLYIEDGSFLRMKNLQLGYTFDSIPYLSKMRVYLAAQNLFTITGYNGVEPEVSGSVLGFGFGGWNYPVQRVYSLGVNVTF